MTFQPGLPRLSPDEVQFLAAPENVQVRRDWLDWLTLLQNTLSMYSLSAPRPQFADEGQLAAALGSRMERLLSTPFYDRAALAMWSLDIVRQLAVEGGSGGHLDEVVDAYLQDIADQYEFVRTYQQISRMDAFAPSREGVHLRRRKY
jgi:hypothetical protein